jgi:hypothetical protein
MQVEGTEHLVSLQIFIPSRGGPTLRKKGRLHGVQWLSKTHGFGLLATIVMRSCNAWKKQVSVVILAKSRTFPGGYTLSELDTIMPPFAYMYKTPCFNDAFYSKKYSCMREYYCAQVLAQKMTPHVFFSFNWK